MTKTFTLVAGLLAATAMPSLAHDAEKLAEIPPGDPYIRVSEALPLPDFLPGLGTLFVNPDTLPAGPFLGYDRDGNLSATIYMTPLEELENGTSYDDLAVGDHNVSEVDIYYNAGHPGVDVPHAHVVLFHDAEAKARLAE
ncbi:MAG: hypothetical protein RI571_15715 [Roseovarius sp.]|nr:hypothetical protein [Roseovarius sp.]